MVSILVLEARVFKIKLSGLVHISRRLISTSLWSFKALAQLSGADFEAETAFSYSFFRISALNRPLRDMLEL